MRTRHPIAFLTLLLACAVAAHGQPAVPAADPADLAKQLADAQDKLGAALRSFSVLQDENAQLKADADKNATEKAGLSAQLDDANREIASLKTRAAAAAQVDSLRTLLRQVQDEVAALSKENADLKTRLALRRPAPAGGLPAPTRPSSP